MVVTDVPVVLEPGDPIGRGPAPLIPPRTVTILFVASVNDGLVRAVSYVHVARGDRDEGDLRSTSTRRRPTSSSRSGSTPGSRIPLDIVEAPFRDLSVPMLEEVAPVLRPRGHVRERRGARVRRDESWQLPLHNQTALFVKRLFLFEERVVVTSVPYGSTGRPTRPPRVVAEHRGQDGAVDVGVRAERQHGEEADDRRDRAVDGRGAGHHLLDVERASDGEHDDRGAQERRARQMPAPRRPAGRREHDVGGERRREHHRDAEQRRRARSAP